jgi:hypothetical protein
VLGWCSAFPFVFSARISENQRREFSGGNK